MRNLNFPEAYVGEPLDWSVTSGSPKDAIVQVMPDELLRAAVMDFAAAYQGHCTSNGVYRSASPLWAVVFIDYDDDALRLKRSTVPLPPAGFDNPNVRRLYALSLGVELRRRRISVVMICLAVDSFVNIEDVSGLSPEQTAERLRRLQQQGLSDAPLSRAVFFSASTVDKRFAAAKIDVTEIDSSSRSFALGVPLMLPEMTESVGPLQAALWWALGKPDSAASQIVELKEKLRREGYSFSNE